MSNHQSSSIIEELRQAAERGDTEAQLILGNMYMLGDGVKRSPTEGGELVSQGRQAGT